MRRYEFRTFERLTSPRGGGIISVDAESLHEALELTETVREEVPYYVSLGSRDLEPQVALVRCSS